MSSAGPEQRYAEAGHDHEHSDVAIRPLFLFLAILAVALIAIVSLIWWLFLAFAHRAARIDPGAPPLAELRTLPPEPRLQADPSGEMQALRDRELATLASLEWIDRQQGIIRIPIERAVELTVERGLPQWPAVEAPTEPTQQQPPAEPPGQQNNDDAASASTSPAGASAP